MPLYRCAGHRRSVCDYEASQRWRGPCPNCGRYYNCEVFRGEEDGKIHTLASILVAPTEYLSTGFPEVDRIMGGGLVKGSTVLFGGYRGAGKSSLLVAIADGVARTGRKVLYASGEESREGVANIAYRLGVLNEHIEVLGNTSEIEKIMERQYELRPFLTVYDSLQVMTCDDVKGSEGSISQGEAVANVITSHHKRTKTCSFVVNHLSRSGDFKGSSTVEHLVDTIMILGEYSFLGKGELDQNKKEGLDTNATRVLMIDKNRNGKECQRAFFEMTERGLKAVIPLAKPVKKKADANVKDKADAGRRSRVLELLQGGLEGVPVEHGHEGVKDVEGHEHVDGPDDGEGPEEVY